MLYAALFQRTVLLLVFVWNFGALPASAEMSTPQTSKMNEFIERANAIAKGNPTAEEIELLQSDRELLLSELDDLVSAFVPNLKMPWDFGMPEDLIAELGPRFFAKLGEADRKQLHKILEPTMARLKELKATVQGKEDPEGRLDALLIEVNPILELVEYAELLATSDLPESSRQNFRKREMRLNSALDAERVAHQLKLDWANEEHAELARAVVNVARIRMNPRWYVPFLKIVEVAPRELVETNLIEGNPLHLPDSRLDVIKVAYHARYGARYSLNWATVENLYLLFGTRDKLGDQEASIFIDGIDVADPRAESLMRTSHLSLHEALSLLKEFDLAKGVNQHRVMGKMLVHLSPSELQRSAELLRLGAVTGPRAPDHFTRVLSVGAENMAVVLENRFEIPENKMAASQRILLDAIRTQQIPSYENARRERAEVDKLVAKGLTAIPFLGIREHLSPESRLNRIVNLYRERVRNIPAHITLQQEYHVSDRTLNAVRDELVRRVKEGNRESASLFAASLALRDNMGFKLVLADQRTVFLGNSVDEIWTNLLNYDARHEIRGKRIRVGGLEIIPLHIPSR